MNTLLSYMKISRRKNCLQLLESTVKFKWLEMFDVNSIFLVACFLVGLGLQAYHHIAGQVGIPSFQSKVPLVYFSKHQREVEL